MILVDDLREFQKEKATTLFYRMVIRRLLRKWPGRMIRSRELRMPRINRTSSRRGSENPSELRD